MSFAIAIGVFHPCSERSYTPTHPNILPWVPTSWFYCPQGIFEAYWCIVEGQKPKETPNSFIAAAPLIVKDLEQACDRAIA